MNSLLQKPTSDELELGDEGVVVAGDSRHDFVPDAAERRVMEDVIEHERLPAPGEFGILHRGKTVSAKLRDERPVPAHIEISGQQSRSTRTGELLRDEPPLLGVLFARGAEHEEREQVGIEQLDFPSEESCPGADQEAVRRRLLSAFELK